VGTFAGGELGILRRLAARWVCLLSLKHNINSHI
jgi:hypothetical protein